MKKKIILIVFIFGMMTSCNDKKENIHKLYNVMNNIELALKTSDSDFVDRVIKEIETMEVIYPTHQSLREKKYILQLRLKRYEDAIVTIDSLLLLSPDDIDNRIVKGILLEILGYKAESIKVYETALEKIDIKIKKMLKNDITKRLSRDVNRIMILKLLGRDTQLDYEKIKNDPQISNNPEILELLILMENGSREVFINNYR